MRTDEQIEKGIECCSEFLCGECPYENIPGIPDCINLKCMHVLINDIKEYVKKLKGSPVETPPLDYYNPVCPRGYMDCVYDPAYIKHCYPDWYKSLYGDLSPEEAIHDPGGCVERMENDPDEKYGCYDDEDK